MAAKWEYAYSLSGNNADVPAVRDMTVTTSQTIAVGDLVITASGLVSIAGDAAAGIVGIAYEACTSAAAGTEIKVAVLEAHHVIKGTADADATALVYGAKTVDINVTTQTLDVGDTSAGCLQVVELGSANTVVYCRVVR
jgi:hypothetical protein